MFLEKNIDEYLYYELDPGFARRAKILLKNIAISNKENVLEVGCGRGFYPNAKISGLEIKDEYIRQANETTKGLDVTIVKGDGRRLPFKDKTFDRIICSEVLEHIDNDSGALEEMYRVLKPHGLAIFTVPHKNYPFLWDPLNWILERTFHTHIPSHIWWLAGIWADHVRLYAEDDFTKKITQANFQIDKVWWATRYCLPFAHFLLYGIGKNIVEKGLGGSFDRFNNQKYSKKNVSLLHRAALELFSFFDKKNDATLVAKGEPYLNIVVRAKK